MSAQSLRLPGFVNAHSHAFQRLLRGRVEHVDPAHPHDDFWTWREAMYEAANAIDPDGAYEVALLVYREMVAAGYTALNTILADVGGTVSNTGSLTNFGVGVNVYPSISWITRIWPSQSGPAPIPIVGMRSSRVICAASSRGTASTTTANAPAASTARASRISCSAASTPLPCTR